MICAGYENLGTVSSYDVHGQRLVESVTVGTDPAVVTRFAYHGGNVWADISIDPSPMITARRFFLDNFDSLIARVENGEVWWHLPDNLGSVRDVTDADGTVVNHKDYDAFGNILSETGAAFGDRYGYTGREFSKLTGLQYNRARYYDPAIGRWTSEDPIHFTGEDTNLYRYVRNFPTGAIDPTGQRLFFPDGQFKKGFFGGITAIPDDGSVAHDAISRLFFLMKELTTTAKGDKAAQAWPNFVTRTNIYDAAFDDIFWMLNTGPFQSQLRDLENFFSTNQPEGAGVWQRIFEAAKGWDPPLLIKPIPGTANGVTVHEAVAVVPTGPFASARAFLANMVDEAKQYGQSMADLWNLGKEVAQLAGSNGPKIIQAVYEAPKKFVGNFLGGAMGGFESFFDLNKIGQNISKGVQGWLFGGLPADALTGLPPVSQIQTLQDAAGFGIGVFERVSGIDKLDENFVTGLFEDVTGLDVDDLRQHYNDFQQFYGGGNIIGTIVQKLDGLTGTVIDGVKDGAISYAKSKIVPTVVTNLVAKLNPGGAVLSTLSTGLKFVKANKDKILGLIKKVFGILNVVQTSTVGTVATRVFDFLKESIPVILDLGARVVGLKDLPSGLRTVIDSLDVPEWIRTAASTFYAKIGEKVQALAQKGDVGGEPLSGKVTVKPDPVNVWLRSKKGSPEIIVGGVPTGTGTARFTLQRLITQWNTRIEVPIGAFEWALSENNKSSVHGIAKRLSGLKAEIRNARRDVLSQNLTGKKRRDALAARLEPLQSQRKAAQHEAMQMLQHLAPQISRLIDQFNAAGPQSIGHPLVQNELKVGTYNSLSNRKLFPAGDKLTPHHVPAGEYITKKLNFAYGSGIAIMMYQPIPARTGDGGRHIRTRTYSGKVPTATLLAETPKQSLENDIADVRKIYTDDGLYSPLVEAALQEVIQENKRKFPGVYDT